jgi:hypothetical protein
MVSTGEEIDPPAGMPYGGNLYDACCYGGRLLLTLSTDEVLKALLISANFIEYKIQTVGFFLQV